MRNEIIIVIKGPSAQNMVDARLNWKEVLRIVTDALAVDEKDVTIEQRPVLE